MNTQLVNKYFQLWNAQDAVQFRSLLTDNVSLTDWDLSVSGIDEVVSANENIWANVPDIKIVVLDMAVNANRAYCHIKVSSESEDFELNVIDVLTFDGEKISRVDAFKN